MSERTLRAEKNGFELFIAGNYLNLSNKYGVLEYGEIEAPDDADNRFAEIMLDGFISSHSVKAKSPTCIKRVAYERGTREYFQLQAVLDKKQGFWTVQQFDSELVYMQDVYSGCTYYDEVIAWMHSHFNILSGLMTQVFRNPLGDCTNGGISSSKDSLCIISAKRGPFEPEDIRECVYLEKRTILQDEYMTVKPLYCQNRWYMSGGNFLYSSDSRYREYTGLHYPVPIHDRYENGI